MGSGSDVALYPKYYARMNIKKYFPNEEKGKMKMKIVNTGNTTTNANYTHLHIYGVLLWNWIIGTENHTIRRNSKIMIEAMVNICLQERICSI